MNEYTVEFVTENHMYRIAYLVEADSFEKAVKKAKVKHQKLCNNTKYPINKREEWSYMKMNAIWLNSNLEEVHRSYVELDLSQKELITQKLRSEYNQLSENNKRKKELQNILKRLGYYLD